MNNKKPPVRLYKEQNIQANNGTFILVGIVLAIFFILCFLGLLTGFNAVESGTTYNGGLLCIFATF